MRNVGLAVFDRCRPLLYTEQGDGDRCTVFKTERERDIQIAMVLSLEHIDSRRIDIYNRCDSLLLDRWAVNII